MANPVKLTNEPGKFKNQGDQTLQQNFRTKITKMKKQCSQVYISNIMTLLIPDEISRH